MSAKAAEPATTCCLKSLRQTGKCDKSGGTLVQRKDDHPDTVKERLRVYHEQTEPLKAYYQKQGKLAVVEGQGGCGGYHPPDPGRCRGITDGCAENQPGARSNAGCRQDLRKGAEAGGRGGGAGCFHLGDRRIVRRYIEGQGAVPTFLGYGGIPASACISVNNVVIHGIPRKDQKLRAGDIVSVDVGATYEGFVGDNAWTFPCGDVSSEAKVLMDATRESLFEGIRAAQAGNRIGDIGSAVQRYVEARGYSVYGILSATE